MRAISVGKGLRCRVLFDEAGAPGETASLCSGIDDGYSSALCSTMTTRPVWPTGARPARDATIARTREGYVPGDEARIESEVRALLGASGR